MHALPAGLSEWTVHPSTGTGESQVLDGGWQQRRADHEFLTSPQARELLQQEAIAVFDYRPFQQAWSRPGQGPH